MLRINRSFTQQNNNNVGTLNTRRPLMIIPSDYENEHMGGQGILDGMKSLLGKVGDIGTNLLNRIPNSDDTGRPLFQGEKHALLKLPNGKMGIGNYIGPGTQLIKRLKRKDPPRTEVDKVAMGHDIRYGIANNINEIRNADKIMIRKVDEIARNKTDSRFNIAQAKLIKAKMIGEDLGLIKRNAFSGDLSLNKALPQGDIALMNEKLKPLEMAGYGKSPAHELKKKAMRKARQMGKGDIKLGKHIELGESPIKVNREFSQLVPKQQSSITPIFTSKSKATDLINSPFSTMARALGDLGIHGAKKLALPFAGLVLAKKSASTMASKILPWIKRKMFGKGMGGAGLKKYDKVLLKHLEKAIVKTRKHMKKGQSGKGYEPLSGSGFFSSFVNIMKKIAKPALKAGMAGLSVVQPELAIPLGVASTFL